MNSSLKMFTNGFDYIIAENLNEAKTILAREWYNLYGCYEDLDPLLKNNLDEMDWKEKNKKERFTLYTENSGGLTRTIADWIKIGGRGFFASSEY